VTSTRHRPTGPSDARLHAVLTKTAEYSAARAARLLVFGLP